MYVSQGFKHFPPQSKDDDKHTEADVKTRKEWDGLARSMLKAGLLLCRSSVPRRIVRLILILDTVYKVLRLLRKIGTH